MRYRSFRCIFLCYCIKLFHFSCYRGNIWLICWWFLLMLCLTKRGCVISHIPYALKGQKLLAQGIALGNVGKNKVALKGQKLSISKLLPFQGDFVVFILKPRALPWARSFWAFSPTLLPLSGLMTHPHRDMLY